MDRRTKPRIDVQLTCFVGDGKVQATPVGALTENVSRTGMLMRWMDGISLPKIGKKLVLDLKLPENSEVGPRVMRCRTEVIRIEAGERNTPNVALRILSMRFIRSRHTSKVVDLASMPLAVDRVI